MPIVQKLMDSLVAKYGKEKGKQVYYSMEATGKGPFASGAKHHDLHLEFAKKNGVQPIKGRSRSGSPAKRSRAGSRSPKRR